MDNAVATAMLQPLFQAARKSLHQVHALVKDRHDQRGFRIAPYTENVVMRAATSSQVGMNRSQGLERNSAGDQRFNAPLEFGKIATGLNVAPLLAGITDDCAKIGFAG